MPYGTGSIQMRGRTWWMIFRDPEGRIIQENSKTDDQSVARVMLAERALETARAKVTALEAIVNKTAAPLDEEATDQGDRSSSRAPADTRAVRRDRGKTAHTSRKSTRQESAPRGKA